MSGLITIGHMRSDFPAKFGVPRQSGLVEALSGRIVFEPAYREPEAFRGLEQFSHIWLLWGFSGVGGEGWSPTVRPPKLGGNTRMGVFATRSPYRPNRIGLSSVYVERIELHTPEGPVIYVKGGDLMDGTPIYDIKPYLPFTDSHAQALAGFTGDSRLLDVCIEAQWLEWIPKDKQAALMEVLRQDPRPGYQADPHRVYGMSFGGMDVRFKVQGAVLTVVEIVRLEKRDSNESQ